MKNLLITGGAGFIGSNFIEFILQKKNNYNLIVVDKLTNVSNIQYIKKYTKQKNFIFIKQDIANFKKLRSIFQDNNIDTVINFAAETHVDNSIVNSKKFINTNIVGTHNLLNCCLNNWNLKKKNNVFIQISTDEVYGSLTVKDKSVNEKANYDPKNPYAASKASADLLIKSFSNTYKLNYIITRSCNNFGPKQNVEKFIPKLINNSLLAKKIPIYGNGQNKRQWIHVRDNCNAIFKILEGNIINSEFNISSNTEYKNIDLANIICERIDNILINRSNLKLIYPKALIYNKKKSKELIDFVDDRKGHDFRYSINSKKLFRETGFKPKIKFLVGLEATIKWYIENNNLWYKKNK